MLVVAAIPCVVHEDHACMSPPSLGSEVLTFSHWALGLDSLSDHVRATALLAAATMSLEAAQKLSIPDLLRVLDGKLREEYSRVQETSLSPALLATSPEPEVRFCSAGCGYKSDSKPSD